MSIFADDSKAQIIQVNMTFEKFIKLTVNLPHRDEETIFEVMEYDVEPLPGHRRNHYPKFADAECRLSFAKSLTATEALIKEALKQAAKWQTEIYCFHVKEFPLGEIVSDALGLSCRLYINHKV